MLYITCPIVYCTTHNGIGPVFDSITLIHMYACQVDFLKYSLDIIGALPLSNLMSLFHSSRCTDILYLQMLLQSVQDPRISCAVFMEPMEENHHSLPVRRVSQEL